MGVCVIVQIDIVSHLQLFVNSKLGKPQKTYIIVIVDIKSPISHSYLDPKHGLIHIEICLK